MPARANLEGYIWREDIQTIGGSIPFESTTSWGGYVDDVSASDRLKLSVEVFALDFPDGTEAKAILADVQTGLLEGIGATPF